MCKISLEDTKIRLKAFSNIIGLLEDINCKRQKVSHNFIEVAGFPHYENVMSNILAFFFDTQEEHGLGDLFIKSLLEVYEKKSNTKITTENFNMYTNTIREHMTPKGNRLDILVFGNYIIGIENKIYADLYNDLPDYYDALVQYKMINKKQKVDGIVPIVLSLYEKVIDNEYFVNITYTELIESVNSNIGRYAFEGNNKWLLYYKEFALNILSLIGDNRMENLINVEFNKFLGDNANIMGKVYDLIDEDIENKRHLLIALNQSITKYSFNLYQSQNNNFKSLYYQIKNSKIKLEINIHLNKIYLNIWQINGDGGILNTIIGKIQKEKSIMFEHSDWWDHSYILDCRDLVNDFDIELYAKEVEKWCEIVEHYINI